MPASVVTDPVLAAQVADGDGRHRYKALTDLGVQIWSNLNRYVLNFDEVKGSNQDLTEEQYIYESNIHRRHLSDDQRVMLAAEFAPYFRKEPAGSSWSPTRIRQAGQGNIRRQKRT